MKIILSLFICSVSLAWAGTPVPATTPYTRSFLKSADEAAGRAALSLVTSNWAANASQFVTVGNELRIKGGSPLTNPVIASGTITGDGSGLTNLTGVSATSGGISVAAGTNGILVVTNVGGDLVTISHSGHFGPVNAASLFVTNALTPDVLASTNAVRDGYVLNQRGNTNRWESPASVVPFVMTSMTNVLSPTNGLVQRITLTGAAQFTLSSYDTNASEFIRLEVAGSNTITWVTANLSNSTALTITNPGAVYLFDRSAMTNLWWGYKLR
jgi:hypothetical protein